MNSMQAVLTIQQLCFRRRTTSTIRALLTRGIKTTPPVRTKVSMQTVVSMDPNVAVLNSIDSTHAASKIMLAHDEQRLWANMPASDWRNSISSSQEHFFTELYEETRESIRAQVRRGQHDVVVEVGCGTGEVIGQVCLPCKQLQIRVYLYFAQISFCSLFFRPQA